MYPNDQPPQYSVDYLNEIAAPTRQPSFFEKKFKIIVIAVIAMLLISIPVIAFGIINSTDRVTADGVALRLKALEVASKNTHGDIGNGELRSLNSSLSIVLANASRDIGTYVASRNNLEQMVNADPASNELLQKLDDATLNAVIDRTYPREMAFQLEIIMLDLERLHNESNNPEFQSLLSEIYDQLEPIKKQFSDIDAASA